MRILRTSKRARDDNQNKLTTMKATDKNALQIAAKGGAIASSDWVRGSGNYVSKRPIPANCIEVDYDRLDKLCERSRIAAQAVIADRPRVRKIIAIANWEAIECLA